MCLVNVDMFYYSEEKAKLLRRITTKIEEKNEELRCVCYFNLALRFRLHTVQRQIQHVTGNWSKYWILVKLLWLNLMLVTFNQRTLSIDLCA